MPFVIVRNDIVNMQSDAIVNAANTNPVIGDGVDSAVHNRAGKELLAARKRIGVIPYGNTAITPAFGLDAKYVIHAVSPIWQGGDSGELELLRNCYISSLKLALEHKCDSVAFPLLSSGNHGFPKDLALHTAVNAISSFLMDHDIKVYLVVFDESSYILSEKLFDSVQSYIDDKYIQDKADEEYLMTLNNEGHYPYTLEERQKSRFACIRKALDIDECLPSTSLLPSEASSRSLEDLIKEAEETFSQSLIRLIDQKGLLDPQVYKKANVDRKLFSKIKNNIDYKPSKTTALAFAIALELNLDETKDLIGRAGYALTHSSKFDIIIEYFIVNGNYDIFEINKVLFAFKQPLICA
ncbi:MAG: macro domain-containing protein [Firmicutes bacterium]|nr:macro domain-containing protein [Bacillota bacterium]